MNTETCRIVLMVIFLSKLVVDQLTKKPSLESYRYFGPLILWAVFSIEKFPPIGQVIHLLVGIALAAFSLRFDLRRLRANPVRNNRS